LNGWDGNLHYREGRTDYVMTGLESYHGNWQEDRRYRFKSCAVRVPVHQCDNIEIRIDNFTPMKVGNPKRIAGVEWVNDNCGGTSTMKFSLDKKMSTKVSASSTYKLSKSLKSTFKFGISQKATASISAKFAGFGGKFSSSFGIKSSWGLSRTTSRTSSTTSKTLQVETLKAGMAVFLKPHTRNVVKSYYRKYDGYIKWSGVASCYIGEKVVSTKNVKGEWRGEAASVHNGSYKAVDEKCAGAPATKVPPPAPSAPPAPMCINLQPGCKFWSHAGFCKGRYEDFMMKNCARHCHPACKKLVLK